MNCEAVGKKLVKRDCSVIYPVCIYLSSQGDAVFRSRTLAAPRLPLRLISLVSSLPTSSSSLLSSLLLDILMVETVVR